MSKYCPLADQITNCTDNCKECLEDEQKDEPDSKFYQELILEQQEQM
jgi:hypothetical protein